MAKLGFWKRITSSVKKVFGVGQVSKPAPTPKPKPAAPRLRIVPTPKPTAPKAKPTRIATKETGTLGTIGTIGPKQWRPIGTTRYWNNTNTRLWNKATEGRPDFRNDETAKLLYSTGFLPRNTRYMTSREITAVRDLLNQYVWDTYGLEWDDIFDWQDYEDSGSGKAS